MPLEWLLELVWSVLQGMTSGCHQWKQTQELTQLQVCLAQMIFAGIDKQQQHELDICAVYRHACEYLLIKLNKSLKNVQKISSFNPTFYFGEELLMVDWMAQSRGWEPLR